MPIAAKHPCAQPGCGQLTADRFCPDHGKRNVAATVTRMYDMRRGSSAARGYDWKWRRFREWYLRRHPICEASAGCDKPADEPHHIVRLEDGGAKYDESNLQPLCKPHHSSLRGAGGRV